MGRLIEAEIAEKRIASLVELIDEICKDVREKHCSDDVCGLCEYDGATQGESGDWYPECPGFETDKCFCMKESFKQKYLEQIPTIEQYGTWIPCSERLPAEKINPITQDYYEYPVTAVFGDVEDIRYYKFGNGHWWHGCSIVDERVIAWMPFPLPLPYREEKM